jgi:hypothetical protein
MTMSTPLSERPAEAPRPARRSLTDLAAMLASDAVVEKLPSRQPAVSPLRGHAINRIGSRPDQDRASQQLDEVTLAAATSARHYRSSMLEDLKVHVIAAPKDGSAAAPANSASHPASQPPAQEKASAAPTLQHPPPAATAGAQDFAADHRAKDFRDKACELINANLNAGLEYARLLANARSPVELVELSTKHAREHFELIIKHAAALAALSRSMMGTKD